MSALVFSGRARDKLTRRSFFHVTASKGTAVGKFIVGSDIRYFYMTPRGHPNKAKETVAVSEKEKIAFRDFLLESTVKKVNTAKGKKKVIR